jgi:hypothetical protein
MYSNIQKKNQIINEFSLWLFDTYEFLGNAQIIKIISRANQILEDSCEYDYLGHKVLFNEITGGF